MVYGNDRLIKELQAKPKNEEIDGQGNIMRIYSIKLSDDENMVIYEGICPSKNEKIYLRVPPEFENKKPIEAKCWTFAPAWDFYKETGEIPEMIIET